MLTIDELSKTIGTYLQPEQVSKVQLAYQFSAEAHDGQKRKSGNHIFTTLLKLLISLVICEWTIKH